MPAFRLYFADCVGDKMNCSYRHEAVIGDAEALRQAVVRDYTAVAYRDGHRANETFLRSDCLAMDIDNDHSENEKQWVTPETVLEHFPEVTIGFHFSRNHMKEKRGKPPRPKFHVFFLIEEMTDPEAYSALKKRVYSIFPFFDPMALDAARFFFGTLNPQVEFHAGTITLNEYLERHYPAAEPGSDLPPAAPEKIIPEGSRNATMSLFAARVLKRLGETDDAYDAFLKKAATCAPPLDSRELNTIWNSALRFYRRISQGEDYVPPEKYGRQNDFLYYPSDCSDVAQARVLAQVFSGMLRYSPATDFIVYRGDIWEETRPGAHAIMHDLSDMQLAEASAAAAAAWDTLEGNGAAELLRIRGKKKAEAEMNEAQKEAYKAYVRAIGYQNTAMLYRQSKNIKAVLQEVHPMVLIRPQDLDVDPFLLNTPDCAYDLRCGLEGAMPHSADHFVTRMTAVQPGEEGKQLWEDALKLFFCGDRDLIRYVQLVAGLIAVGKVYVEAMIIAYGDGRNGKSTFWNTLARVMGTYSGSIAADALTVGCLRNVRPELAEAKGKRMLIASELEEGTRLNTSIVKQLCSTDDVSAEKKYKDPFTYTPSHTVVLYTNHLPKVGAMDAGIWRRLIVIPFNAKIEGKSDVKNYSDFLFKNAGGAILSWIIEGAKEVIGHEFKIPLPACVQQAIRQYRDDNDWLGHFLNECCEVDNGLQAKSGELYAAYRTFCARTGEYTRSTTDFYTALENEGITRQKTRNGAFLIGVALTRTEEGDDFLK